MTNIQKYLDIFLLLNIKFSGINNTEVVSAIDKNEILQLSKQMLRMQGLAKNDLLNATPDEQDELLLIYGEKLFDCIKGKYNENDIR
jgi:hypothetical protein